jgi:serine/threonine protein phosphatase PrpC
MTKLTLLFGEHTDPGPRESNQDTVLSVELPDGRRLVAVADGMGGLSEGERAGKTALAALYRSLSEGGDLFQAISDANTAVFRESSGLASGTTLVAAILNGNRLEIVNVGDSRAYHLDRLGLLQVTRDHTMGEEATRSGTVAGFDTAPSRWSGALARFLGARETVDPDIFGPLNLDEGDWLLLCSDGQYRGVADEDMEAHLKGTTDPKQAATQLVEMALAGHTEDNISVALVYRPEVNEGEDVTDDAPRGAPPSRAPSVWDPETIFARSPRNGKEQKGLGLAFVVIVGLLALLIAAFMVLDRVMSP